MATARDPDLLMNTYRRLADGTVCRIRPSRPDDRDLVEACFNGLSPQSWRQRFFSAKHALTSADLDRLCEVDGRDHIAFAAVLIDETGRELEALGFARCMRLGPGSNQGELAVTVVDRCQRQGLGTALVKRLVPAARDQGIESMRCEVLTTNSGMRRLAQHLGGHVLWSESGTMEYDCPLPAPAVQVAAPLTAATPGYIPAQASGQAPIRKPEPMPGPMPDRSRPTHHGSDLPWFLRPTAWLDAWLALGAATRSNAPWFEAPRSEAPRPEASWFNVWSDPWRNPWPASLFAPLVVPPVVPPIAPWLWSHREPGSAAVLASAPVPLAAAPVDSIADANPRTAPAQCRLPDRRPAASLLPVIAEGAELWWRLLDDCVAAATIGSDALSPTQPPA